MRESWYKIMVYNSEENDHVCDLNVNGRASLKLLLEKLCVLR